MFGTVNLTGKTGSSKNAGKKSSQEFTNYQIKSNGNQAERWLRKNAWLSAEEYSAMNQIIQLHVYFHFLW